MRPTISIIVPNYNGARHLRACLDSIVSQQCGNCEVVLIDGASTDDSLAIARAYGSAISVLISDPDNGQSDAINKGISRCSGDVIAYVNSDDTLEAGSLDTVGQFFAENPGAEWLAGGCRVFGESTPPWILQPEGWTRLIDTVLPWSRPQRYVFPQSGACFMRRSLIERLGEYDTSLHYSMDMEYYARAAFAGAVMHIVPDVLAGWRMHPHSKSWTRGCAYAFRKDECAILARYLPQLPDVEREEAAQALKSELPNLALREADYWTRQNRRLAGLRTLMRLAFDRPEWMFRRPWIGGIRRVFAGYQA